MDTIGSEVTQDLDADSRPSPGWADLTVLQCELRTLFARRPANRALAESLRRIGDHLGADYAVVHAQLGAHLLSEEWWKPGAMLDSRLRDTVNEILGAAEANEPAGCARLHGDEHSRVVVTALIFDGNVEQAGAAALVFANCDEEHALHNRLCLEGVMGCLALLVDGPKRRTKAAVDDEEARSAESLAARRRVEPTNTADHPVRLALAIATDIKNHYGFDLTAVGFVRGDRVEVMAISGQDEVRPAHPGVQLIRAAMEECLDRRRPVVYSGDPDAGEHEVDCRLHAQWSTTLNRDPVASFPLRCLDEVVAIVSMSRGAATHLDGDRVVKIAEEMSGYAALVPLSCTASRSLPEHAAHSMRSLLRNFMGRGKLKVVSTLVVLFIFSIWLVFGQLSYTFTVPCVVEAADRFVALCPRDGILDELFVRPGDRVRADQLLAVLDVNKETLHREELRAEIESLEAQADEALAKSEFGRLRIHRAKKRSLLALLAVVEANIEEAQIRAPRDGIILEGDLREQLGGRLRAGDEMFKIARYDRAVVVLKVPERLVLAARDLDAAVFSPAADPTRRYELHALRVSPASTVVDEQNVFLGEATVLTNLDGIAPGMEGIAYLDAGHRPPWWVLTHRLTDWLRLNFWM